jgi:hypothetical protein
MAIQLGPAVGRHRLDPKISIYRLNEFGDSLAASIPGWTVNIGARLYLDK